MQTDQAALAMVTLPTNGPGNPGPQVALTPQEEWRNRQAEIFSPGTRVIVKSTYKSAKVNAEGTVEHTRPHQRGIVCYVRWDNGGRPIDVPTSRLRILDDDKERERMENRYPQEKRNQHTSTQRKTKKSAARKGSKANPKAIQASLEMAYQIINERRFDDEIQTLVSILFPEEIPTTPEFLTALRAWWDATEKLLAAGHAAKGSK